MMSFCDVLTCLQLIFTQQVLRYKVAWSHSALYPNTCRGTSDEAKQHSTKLIIIISRLTDFTSVFTLTLPYFTYVIFLYVTLPLTRYGWRTTHTQAAEFSSLAGLATASVDSFSVRHNWMSETIHSTYFDSLVFIICVPAFPILVMTAVYIRNKQISLSSDDYHEFLWRAEVLAADIHTTGTKV